MIKLTVHPTVGEIRWVPEITTPTGDLHPKGYQVEAIWATRNPDRRDMTGIDTIAWVGSWSNPYFSARVIQVADTGYDPLPVTAITIERGKKTKMVF